MKENTIDSEGVEVKKGDIVRVISIAPSTIEKLNDEEKRDVQSMLGETFEVEEIDEYGSAWVSKWWKRGSEKSESHSLGLSPSEMTLVSNESRT